MKSCLSCPYYQSWPYCQYCPHCQNCPHRDRAYGLKIFSVLFVKFFFVKMNGVAWKNKVSRIMTFESCLHCFDEILYNNESLFKSVIWDIWNRLLITQKSWKLRVTHSATKQISDPERIPSDIKVDQSVWKPPKCLIREFPHRK